MVRFDPHSPIFDAHDELVTRGIPSTRAYYTAVIRGEKNCPDEALTFLWGGGVTVLLPADAPLFPTSVCCTPPGV